MRIHAFFEGEKFTLYLDTSDDALKAAHQNLKEAGIRETADLHIIKLMRQTPLKRTPLYNGAMECRLLEYKIMAGSNRSK